MVINCPMLYGKLLSMIDIEMLAAIMKELGYLDETEEDKAVKPNDDESLDRQTDKSKIYRPSES